MLRRPLGGARYCTCPLLDKTYLKLVAQ